MVSDAEICDVVAELYDTSNEGPQGFDDLLWPEADDGVCAALKRYPDFDLVLFRGSTTPQDWARDFLALPHQLTTHPQLGDIHAGFALGMETAYAHLQPLLIKPNVVVTGHSLGAGRASIFSGLLTAQNSGLNISTVVFGEPRSGCDRLRVLLAGNQYRSYRNADPSGAGHDLVTDVPPDPPFARNRPLTDVFGAPGPNDPWGPFRYHHIQLYQEALYVL